MKVAVRYFSKTGNTKKIADAIAKEAGVDAAPVSQPLAEDVDILFLGAYVMAGGVTKEVKNFVKDINVSVGEVVSFSTHGINGSTYGTVKKLVESKGISMSDKEFNSKGSFKVLHKSRPNNDDLNEAKAFAKKIIG